MILFLTFIIRIYSQKKDLYSEKYCYIFDTRTKEMQMIFEDISESDIEDGGISFKYNTKNLKEETRNGRKFYNRKNTN